MFFHPKTKWCMFSVVHREMNGLLYIYSRLVLRYYVIVRWRVLFFCVDAKAQNGWVCRARACLSVWGNIRQLKSRLMAFQNVQVVRAGNEEKQERARKADLILPCPFGLRTTVAVCSVWKLDERRVRITVPQWGGRVIEYRTWRNAIIHSTSRQDLLLDTSLCVVNSHPKVISSPGLYSIVVDKVTRDAWEMANEAKPLFADDPQFSCLLSLLLILQLHLNVENPYTFIWLWQFV